MANEHTKEKYTQRESRDTETDFSAGSNKRVIKTETDSKREKHSILFILMCV